LPGVTAYDDEDYVLSQMTEEAEKLNELLDRKRKEEGNVESLSKRLSDVAEEIEGMDNKMESSRSLSKRKANVMEIREDELKNIARYRDSKLAQAWETHSQKNRYLQLQLTQAQEDLNYSIETINDKANKEMHAVEVKQDKLLAELDTEIDDMTAKEGTPDSPEHFRMLRNDIQNKEYKSIKQQLFLAEGARDRISEEYDTEFNARVYTSMHVKSGL
jgi:hypothetical protein